MQAAVVGGLRSEQVKSTRYRHPAGSPAQRGVEFLGVAVVNCSIGDTQGLVGDSANAHVAEIDRIGRGWAGTGKAVGCARDAQVLCIGVVEVVEYVYLLAGQQTRTGGVEGHRQIAGIASRNNRAVITGGDTAAGETSIGEIAAVDRRLDRATQIRTAGIGVADLIVLGHRTSDVDIAKVHDAIASGGAADDVARQGLRCAGSGARSQDKSGAGDIAAVVEAVARAKVGVLVVFENGNIICAEIQASSRCAIVYQGARTANCAKHQGPAWIDFHRTGASRDATCRCQCAAASLYQAGVVDQRVEGSKTTSSPAVRVARGREGAAAEFDQAMIVDRNGRRVVAVCQHMQRTAHADGCQRIFELNRSVAGLNHGTRSAQNHVGGQGHQRSRRRPHHVQNRTRIGLVATAGERTRREIGKIGRIHFNDRAVRH